MPEEPDDDTMLDRALQVALFMVLVVVILGTYAVLFDLASRTP